MFICFPDNFQPHKLYKIMVHASDVCQCENFTRHEKTFGVTHFYSVEGGITPFYITSSLIFLFISYLQKRKKKKSPTQCFFSRWLNGILQSALPLVLSGYALAVNDLHAVSYWQVHRNDIITHDITKITERGSLSYCSL